MLGRRAVVIPKGGAFQMIMLTSIARIRCEVCRIILTILWPFSLAGASVSSLSFRLSQGVVFDGTYVGYRRVLWSANQLNFSLHIHAPRKGDVNLFYPLLTYKHSVYAPVRLGSVLPVKSSLRHQETRAFSTALRQYRHLSLNADHETLSA